jgi:uncharacterized protein (UPF0276 family)
MIGLGRGVGLRPELASTLCAEPRFDGLDFLELAPENWLGIGGRKREQLDAIAGKYPLIAHGLSLSIADAEPLNIDFVWEVRRFLDDYAIEIYSEHLSLSRDASGYLYELFPAPRRKANIEYLVSRIRRVQDLIGRRLVLENISYYHRYAEQMPEGEFLAEIADRSGCGLLLDLNNAYVNGRNHGEDALAFVRSLPSEAVAYYHIAGHAELDGGVVLDTHGAPVAADVVRLAREAWTLHGPRPLLLERDHFVPSLGELVREIGEIQRCMIAGDDDARAA